PWWTNSAGLHHLKIAFFLLTRGQITCGPNMEMSNIPQTNKTSSWIICFPEDKSVKI
ncbi:hypothetical protein XENORESO_012112, partial [Xenotaenia resolanae]